MTTRMTDDWAAARSDKWRRQLAGMEAMLAPIDEPLILALDLDRPLRIADIGCGGGATAIAVSRRSWPGSVTHGFDLSPALIEVARRRHTTRDGSLGFEVADMAHAAPRGLPYERLVSRLGVMFFNDAPSAFANLRRWLVPGGRFAFAVWGPIERNAWMATVRTVVADVVTLPQIELGAPGPFRYGQVAVLHQLLNSAGFNGIEISTWSGRLPIGGGMAAAPAAQFALASFSSFAELLANANPEASHRARHALTERFAANERDGAVLMDACVHIVSGRAAG